VKVDLEHAIALMRATGTSGRAASESPDEVDLSLFGESPSHEDGTRPAGDALHIVTLGAFASENEPGADAIAGPPGEALIPEGGNVMIYGDGGAGKTTLSVDLAVHLAAGDDWLGILVAKPVRVLLVELEGPRPLFRQKLRRKQEAWQGSPIEDRVLVLETPWARLSAAEDADREALADAIQAHKVDVVIVGPVTRFGMNEAGTLRQVGDFMLLVGDLRRRSGRAVTVVLIHHENKGGAVSGAWEGSGDTLFHVQGQGYGHTRLFVEKARWASSLHCKGFRLAWTDGEGFTVEDKPLVTDDMLAEEILAAVLANGGASWNKIDEETSGKGERKRALRDRLLAGGRLVDAGTGSRMALWHADDPARPPTQEALRPDRDAPGDAPVSGTGETDHCGTASLRPDVVRDAGRRDAVCSPADADQVDQVAELPRDFEALGWAPHVAGAQPSAARAPRLGSEPPGPAS
jgi:hypothetical protein